MKPDYGLNLFQSGIGKNIAQHFYDTPIDHISRVDPDIVSTMVNIVKDDVEYAISFDLHGKMTIQLLAALPTQIQKTLSAWLADPNTLYKTLDLPAPIVIRYIEATLGAVQTGQNGEKFVPFVVQKVV